MSDCSASQAFVSRSSCYGKCLSLQVEQLPSGNEGWLDTERELTAAETTLLQLGEWP